MKKFFSCFSDVCLIISGVIGAGFVCGKEQNFYFNGVNPIFAGAVFALLFGLSSFAVMNFARMKNIGSVEEVFSPLKHGKVVEIPLLMCFFVVITTMLAAADECMRMVFNTPAQVPVCAFLCSLAAAFTLFFGIKGAEKFGLFAAPLFVILIIIAASAAPRTAAETSAVLPNPAKGAAYALFNAVMMSGVLLDKGKGASKKHIIAVCSASAVTLGALIAAVLYSTKGGSSLMAMPLIEAVKGTPALYYALAAAVFVAIVTSATSSALPVVKAFDVLTGDRVLSCGAVFFAATLFSMFGFDFMLKYLYPLVSAAGLVFVIYMLFGSFSFARAK